MSSEKTGEIAAGESYVKRTSEMVGKPSLWERFKEGFRERFSVENAVKGAGIAGITIIAGVGLTLSVVPMAEEVFKAYLPSVALGLLTGGFLLGGILGRSRNWKESCSNKLGGLTS